MPTKPADPLAIIPDPMGVFKNPDQANFVRRLISAVSYALMDRPGANVATTSILLSSPNGTVYRVTVDDMGVLNATSAR